MRSDEGRDVFVLPWEVGHFTQKMYCVYTLSIYFFLEIQGNQLLFVAKR